MSDEKKPWYNNSDMMAGLFATITLMIIMFVVAVVTITLLLKFVGWLL